MKTSQSYLKRAAKACLAAALSAATGCGGRGSEKAVDDGEQRQDAGQPGDCTGGRKGTAYVLDRSIRDWYSMGLIADLAPRYEKIVVSEQRIVAVYFRALAQRHKDDGGPDLLPYVDDGSIEINRNGPSSLPELTRGDIYVVAPDPESRLPKTLAPDLGMLVGEDTVAYVATEHGGDVEKAFLASLEVTALGHRKQQVIVRPDAPCNVEISPRGGGKVCVDSQHFKAPGQVVSTFCIARGKSVAELCRGMGEASK